MEEIKYRMYGLVPYNLSPIQQGIQFGHGVVEYIMNNMNKPETQLWTNKDKTFIILNGGTTNKNPENLGTLNTHLQTLKDSGIIVSEFYEPDLGDQLTSVNFLVPEQVWDYEKYPDLIENTYWGGSVGLSLEAMRWYKEWEERLGGEKNVWLRGFLKQFRLA